VTAALLLGVGIAAGLWFLVTGLAPAPVPLDRALAEIHRRRPSLAPIDTAKPSMLARLLGAPLADSDFGRKLTYNVAADLRITSMSPAEHLASRVALGLTGLLWAPLTATIMAAGGVHIGAVFPLWISLALAPVGFLYPSLALRSKAIEQRRNFRHAFSAFLDVVSVSLAGGRGVESAIHAGAESGHGWAFTELRRALLEARLRGETPWTGLGRLGEELAVPELGELAASAALAGAEGARVRASLAAKARTLRLRGLAEIESAAQSASERMSLPVVGLMLGFIVFLACPAINQVLTGL
jgi:Flp pilus assembly protein TadB